MDITGFSDKQQKILQFLVKEKEGMTIEQIFTLLDISRSAIHQHMTILERDGYVRKFSSTQTGGRPGNIFVLTGKGIHLFPKHYNLVAEMLINMIKQKLGTDKLIQYLQEIGVSLAKSQKGSLQNKPLNEQIRMAVAIMEELGYDAQAVDSSADQNLMIDAYNCVFHDLAYSSEEVCELDLAFLSTLLNSKIEHACCMVKGDKQCRFKIRALDKDISDLETP